MRFATADSFAWGGRLVQIFIIDPAIFLPLE